MKGIVFTEFLEMVENEFSYEVADKIIEENSLTSNGAYTSVGNYDNKELLMLVSSLSNHINKPVDELVHAYGKYLLKRFLFYFHTFLIVSKVLLNSLIPLTNTYILRLKSSTTTLNYQALKLNELARTKCKCFIALVTHLHV